MTRSPKSRTSSWGSVSGWARRHARDELSRRKGLDEIVVGTKLEANDAILDLALCGEHNDGHVGRLADGTAHALARELGKHEVENHEVKRVLLELLDGALTVADATHDIVLVVEIGSHDVPNCLLVFYQQNLLLVRSHAASFKLRCTR